MRTTTTTTTDTTNDGGQGDGDSGTKPAVGMKADKENGGRAVNKFAWFNQRRVCAPCESKCIDNTARCDGS